jgi:hypothetical protein
MARQMGTTALLVKVQFSSSFHKGSCWCSRRGTPIPIRRSPRSTTVPPCKRRSARAATHSFKTGAVAQQTRVRLLSPTFSVNRAKGVLEGTVRTEFHAVYQHFYESYMGQGKSVYAVNCSIPGERRSRLAPSCDSHLITGSPTAGSPISG